jgi:hypothetical protein
MKHDDSLNVNMFTRMRTEFYEIFRNMLACYGELRALHPHTKREGRPLSTVRNCYLIYSQLRSVSGNRIFHPQPQNSLCHGDKESI